MSENIESTQINEQYVRPVQFGYRLLAMILISIFGAVAMFYVRETPSEVANVLWVIGIVYTSVVGVSIAGRVRGGGYQTYPINRQSPYINNQSRRPL